MLRQGLWGLAAVVVTVGPSAAQETGSFAIGPRLGYVKYAKDTGIRAGPLVGLDGLFFVTRNVGVGFLLSVGRAETDSSYFPAEMSIGDTTFIFGVKQPLTMTQFQVQAAFRFGGRIQPFISGSAGGYRVNLDPQVAQGPDSFTKLGMSVGGGVEFSVGSATGIWIEARDFIFTSFNRDAINPVTERFLPQRFPDVLPVPEPFSGTAHNLQVALGFTFVPGGR
jgi:hypothetical protein